MSKSILQSIKPQYCKLIASGRKTIEVRKTRPKLDEPFKVYIYCTKDELLTKSHNNGAIYLSKNKYKSALEKAGNATLSGKVIGEYVCDEIFEYQYMNQGYNYWDYEITDDDLYAVCLSHEDFLEYGMGATLYGWRISNLKIYDKPKELSEFYTDCYPDDKKCQRCPHYREPDIYGLNFCSTYFEKHLTRPPQSWCYVEEV